MNEVEEVQYIFVLIFHDCVPLNVFKKALTYITCNAFLSLYSAGPQYAAVVKYVLILALAVVLWWKFLPLSMLSPGPDFPPAAGHEVARGWFGPAYRQLSYELIMCNFTTHELTVFKVKEPICTFSL